MIDFSEMSDDCINRLVSRELKIPFGDNFCNDPAEAWQIIIENEIAIMSRGENDWVSTSNPYRYMTHKDSLYWTDRNPLRAAMIVFLKMKGAKNANPI